MKNIYKITKGQLIVIWVFGLLGFFSAFSEADYSGFASFLAILIPALLLFYTIGWRSFNIVKEKNNENEFKITNYLPKKRNVIKAFLLIGVICIVGFSIFYLVNKNKNDLRMKQLEKDYQQAIPRVALLDEQLTTCMKPVLDKIYQAELRDCNLQKDKIRAEYDFCVMYDYRNSKSACLLENDYEKIVCPKETTKAQDDLKMFITPKPEACQSIADEFSKVNRIIFEYTTLKGI